MPPIIPITESLVYAPDEQVICEACARHTPRDHALMDDDDPVRPAHLCIRCALTMIEGMVVTQRTRFEGFVSAVVSFRKNAVPLARLLFVREDDVKRGGSVLTALAGSLSTRELDADAPDCVGCLTGSPVAKLHTCAPTERKTGLHGVPEHNFLLDVMIALYAAAEGGRGTTASSYLDLADKLRTVLSFPPEHSADHDKKLDPPAQPG